MPPQRQRTMADCDSLARFFFERAGNEPSGRREQRGSGRGGRGFPLSFFSLDSLSRARFAYLLKP